MEPLGISQGYRLAHSLYFPSPFLTYTGMKVSPITCWRTHPSRLSSKELVLLFCSRIVPQTITYKIIWKQKMVLTGRETSHVVPALLLPTLTITGNSYLFLRNLRLCPASSTQTCCCGKTPGSASCCNDFLVRPEASLHMCHRLDGIRILTQRCVARWGQLGTAAIRVLLLQVDCCSLPGSQPTGQLEVGQVRCSGRSQSPPEERGIDFPETKSWRNMTGSL